MFLELLQIALGNRERLSRIPTAKEWEGIYDESGRQAVTGILLHGLDKLPAEQRPPQMVLLQWRGEGQMIEQLNQVMDKRCCQLLRKLNGCGLRGSILKGQGIALLYDNELHSLRQSGDIDVYVDCGQKRAMEFARSTGQGDVEWDYKHLHLNLWNDTEVEMHYRVEVLLNLWKNRKLQKWFKEHEDQIFGHTDSTEHSEIYRMMTPTVEFNVYYILLHIYRHFLYEGVGMRQIIDYYFVLKAIANTEGIDKTNSATEAVSQFGIKKFARGLMWVMKEALGMPSEWMLWEPDAKEGKYILKQVMTGGNFGHYDERLQHGDGKLGAVKAILIHNLHLLTHYPSDVIWSPVWIVWHKLWKMTRRV